MSQRYIVNTLGDYSESSTLVQPVVEVINKAAERLLNKFEAEAPSKIVSSEYTVYSGSAGMALMYLKLSDIFDRNENLIKARSILQNQTLTNCRHDFTFLCGDVGPIAVRAVVHHRFGMERELKTDLDLIHKFGEGCVSVESGEADELLYGRAGYLYALLFIEAKIKRNTIDPKLISNVVGAIIESGKLMAAKIKCPPPLMYQWHNSYYLGTAHGLAGILIILLEARDFLSPENLLIIRRTVDYLLTLGLETGNYPPSVGSESDRLVHWCHGAPGFLFLFAEAYDMYGDERYLNEAKRCADCIWERGLLKKGYGLCHGVAGNGYCFLRMYRLTNDKLYLHRALQFGTFCAAYGTHGCRVPDRLYSLYEGLAGTVCFLFDVARCPASGTFPGFEI